LQQLCIIILIHNQKSFFLPELGFISRPISNDTTHQVLYLNFIYVAKAGI
jgi:hypothetical protein